MTPNIKELYGLISDLSVDEIDFISSRLGKGDLERVQLLNNTKTIKELNSIQDSDEKISAKEIKELSLFIRNVLSPSKKKSEPLPIEFTHLTGDYGLPKVVVSRKEELDDAQVIEHIESDSLKFIYDTILHYLKEHRPSYEMQILKWIEEAETLFDKKLFQASFYYFENSYKLAKKYEAFHHLNSLLAWKKKFVLYGIDKENKLQDIDDELLSVREKAANYWQYKIINQKLIQGKSKIYTDDDKLRKIKELQKEPLLNKEEGAISISAKIHFHQTNAMIAHLLQDFLLAKDHWRKMIEICQTHPQFIYQNITPYIYTIHNYLNLCIQLKQYDEMEKGIEMLNDLPHKFPYIINRVMFEDIKSKVYYHKFNLYFNSCEFYKTFKMVAEIDRFLSKSKTPIKSTFKAVLLYDLSYALYMYGKYNKSVQKLDEIINMEDADLSNDFKIMAHCLKIINYIDQESHFRLAREVEEIQKLMTTKGMQNDYYNAFLELTAELNNCKSKDKQKKIYSRYREIFDEIIQKDANWIDANYFDLISWIDSKIDNKVFREVLRIKINKKAS